LTAKGHRHVENTRRLKVKVSRDGPGRTARWKRKKKNWSRMVLKRKRKHFKSKLGVEKEEKPTPPPQTPTTTQKTPQPPPTPPTHTPKNPNKKQPKNPPTPNKHPTAPPPTTPHTPHPKKTTLKVQGVGVPERKKKGGLINEAGRGHNGKRQGREYSSVKIKAAIHPLHIFI